MDNTMNADDRKPVPAAQWLDVIRHAPLVSIDLIVQDPEGRILLGLRNNEPAKGSWFVPGGAIRKGETLDHAFARLTRQELGREYRRDQARWLGLYEHFYDTNFSGAPGVATHYVVLAHYLRVDQLPEHAGDDQHQGFRAARVSELLADPDVHANTRAYFPL